MNITIPSLFFVVVLLFASCSTEQTTEQEVAIVPRDTVQKAMPPMEFRVFTDTVRTQNPATRNSVDSRSLSSKVRFMVQIGAFQDPQNATRVQLLARERYHLPVFNDFHPTYSLYQVRIGFFETYDSAFEFRGKMFREFPEDYKDSWVVQLKR